MASILPCAFLFAGFLGFAIPTCQGARFASSVTNEVRMTPEKLDLAIDRSMTDMMVMQYVRRTFNKTSLDPDASSSGKVAYMFLVKDGLDQNELWRGFFDGATPGTYSIYMHQWKPDSVSAAAARAQWEPLGAHFIPNVKTGWGQLAGVEYALLWEALRDPDNAQFAFASEGTVPLRSAGYVYSYLMRAPSESKICFNKPEKYISLEYNERTSSCGYRDSIQGVKLPTKLKGGTEEEVAGRVRKHHQWLVLSRRHAVDVINFGERGLQRHLSVLYRAWLPDEMDPAMLGANDESFVATSLLSALEDRGLATQNSLQELDSYGVKSECTTFVYWRHCFKKTALGSGAGWNSSKVKELVLLGGAMWETPRELWSDPRKSPAKVLNDSPRNFGLTDAQPNHDYLHALVDTGLLFARKFGLDENGKLSRDLSKELPPLWEALEKEKGPWPNAKLAHESQAWPVLDVDDERVRQTAYQRIPKKAGGIRRCCCTGPDPSECSLLHESQLAWSMNPFTLGRRVCDKGLGFRKYSHYGWKQLPPNCMDSLSEDW